MTPKEKANELVEKYLKLEIEIGGEFDGYLTMKMHDVKECAHIVADEAIILANLMDGGFSFEKEIEFWQDVKREIDAL